MRYGRIALAACLAAVLTVTASAQFKYSGRAHVINAGVALLDQNPSAMTVASPPAGSENLAPFIWYNLSKASGVLPPGWIFDNPIAPSQVTPAINARWGAAAVLGAPVTPADAAYWEVQLSGSTDAQLSRFDVLIVPAYTNLSLSSYERERLLRFVDQGGTLWIDTEAGSSSIPGFSVLNSFPTPFKLGAISSAADIRVSDFLNPLLNSPHQLSAVDLRAMEDSAGLAFDNLSSGDLGTPTAAVWSLLADSGRLSKVVLHGAYATVGTASIGDGHVVVTTSGVARILNYAPDPNASDIPPLANVNYYALPPSVSRQSTSAARFAVNAVSLNSSYSHGAQGPRGQNSIVTDLGAPLFPRYSVPLVGASKPTFYKGLMVVTAGNKVRVFSAKPGSVLDSSSALDYGIPDYGNGTSYDEIWESQVLTGPVSPPTCVEVPNHSGTPLDQILVVDGSGNLLGFDAFNLNGSGVINPSSYSSVAPFYSVAPPSAASRTRATTMYAPTVHEGVVYVTDGVAGAVGRLWMANPATGVMFTDGSAPFYTESSILGTMPEFSASATVGYIPVQDNSGALDKVAYVPAYPSGASGPQGNASLYSEWIGVKGETYTIGADSTANPNCYLDSSGNQLVILTRASQDATPKHIYTPASPSDVTDPLAVKITLIHAGSVVTDLSSYFSGGASESPSSAGVLNIPFSGSGPSAGDVIQVDYTISWAKQTAASATVCRGYLTFPDQSGNPRSILGSLTLAPNGNLFAVLSSGVSPGSSYTTTVADSMRGGDVYDLKEDQGRGLFTLYYRYEAYDSLPMTMAVGYDPTHLIDATPDNDGYASPVGSSVSGSSIKNLTFTSPVAVRNGVAYVLASGWKNTSGANWVPTSAVIALTADPDLPRIVVSEDLTGKQLQQEDATTSPTKSSPTSINVMTTTSMYNYTKDPNGGNGIVEVQNMMDVKSGAITSAIAANLPVILHATAGGSQDEVLEPNTNAGSTWNPMLWYAVFPGYQLSGAPVLTGDTLFAGGESALASVVQNVLPATTSPTVVAMNTSFDPSDTQNASQDANRPWMNQAHILQGAVASSNLLWPSGIVDASSLAVAAQQVVVNTAAGTIVNGISTGDGAFVVQGDQGLSAFDGGSILVADAGRLAQFTAGGDTLWTLEESLNSATSQDVGGDGLVHDLVTPARAYPYGGDTVVVDRGANRVVRMSDSGREVRSIDRMYLDPARHIDGMAAGESQRLSKPGDVTVYAEFVASGNNTFTNPQALEYWVHYLIADTGNNRLVDLVDRYAANATTGQIGDPVAVGGVAQLGMLNWHTPSAQSGSTYSYNNVARTLITDVSGTRGIIVASIGGAIPGVESTGNGSIMIFDGANVSVVGQAWMPDVPANVFWNPASTAFLSDEIVPHYKKFQGLVSLSLTRSGSSAYPNIMVTDASGVYELTLSVGNSSPRTSTDWQVSWMLPNAAFTSMIGLTVPNSGSPGVPSIANAPGCRFTYAQRLDADNVLLTNGFQWGETFKGEVVIVSGTIDATNSNSAFGFGFGKTNFGFGTNSLRYTLSSVKGSRGIQSPVFAIRR